MNPRSIALFRTDRIGDLVLTLPAMKAVKDALPTSRVAAVVAPRTRELADGQPFLDEVFGWDPEVGPGKLRVWLQARKFDAVLFFFPRPVAAVAAWKEGIPIRIGSGYRWYSAFFNKRVAIRRRHSNKHELELNFELLRPLGITATTGPLIPPVITPGAEREASAIVHAAELPKRFAIVHPGSGGSALNASPDWYGGLISSIEATGLPVAVTGTDEEASRILPSLENAGFSADRYLDPTSLGALASLLSRACVVIGPSTGPLHLAAASGVPTVGLYPNLAPQSPIRWRPRGPVGEVLQPPATPRMANPMDAIPLPDVLAAISRVARP